METFTNNKANYTSGLRVESKFKSLFRKQIWNKFNLSDRNFLCSLKNYYDCNGFLTIKQYNVLKQKYNNHIENVTEFQSEGQ